MVHLLVAVFEAPASGINVKLELARRRLPSWCSRRYTQVQPNRKIRHFGMDAEIQAMDGNKPVVQMLDLGN